jgi:hypothetical protein
MAPIADQKPGDNGEIVLFRDFQVEFQIFTSLSTGGPQCPIEAPHHVDARPSYQWGASIPNEVLKDEGSDNIALETCWPSTPNRRLTARVDIA